MWPSHTSRSQWLNGNSIGLASRRSGVQIQERTFFLLNEAVHNILPNEVILTASMASDGLNTTILFGRDVIRNNLCKMSDLIN